LDSGLLPFAPTIDRHFYRRDWSPSVVPSDTFDLRFAGGNSLSLKRSENDAFDAHIPICLAVFQAIIELFPRLDGRNGRSVPLHLVVIGCLFRLKSQA